MAFWKQKHNQTGGFSLVEIVVAITILGIVVVPMFSSLLFSYRLNQRSDERLQAQLAVSSAVETIMAEGYNLDWDEPGMDEKLYCNRFPSVSVTEIDSSEPAIKFKVTSDYAEDISVTTYARRFPEGGGSSD